MSDPEHATTPSDADIIALAKAEREAGVPDVQTAQASADAKRRMSDADEAARSR